MHQQPRPLSSAYEIDYATAVIGADMLLGGNVGSASGKDHFIADHWPKDLQLPDIYTDKVAQEIMNAGGASKENASQVKAVVEKYDLRGLSAKVIAAENSGDSDVHEFVTGTMTSIGLMIETACALAQETELPRYEDRFASVTGGLAPKVLPIDEAIEELADSLIALGKNPKTKDDALAMAHEWETGRYVKPENFLDLAKNNIARLLGEIRTKVLKYVDFNIPGYDPHLADVLFDGIKFNTVSNTFFTGSLTYVGGIDDMGKPLLECNYEYNTDHPLTAENMWHLAGHEGIPGHYMQMAIMDLMRRNGKFGIEAAISPMCTGETTLMEGWAQAVPELLYGERSRAVLGPHYRVHTALERLQDMAKNNVSILHQVQKMPIETLRDMLSSQYGLNPAIVKKMSGGWAQHPVLGPMYGPAYWLGGEAVRGAIKKYGPLEVAKTALHTEGIVDQNVFNLKMARKMPLTA